MLEELHQELVVHRMITERKWHILLIYLLMTIHHRQPLDRSSIDLYERKDFLRTNDENLEYLEIL